VGSRFSVDTVARQGYLCRGVWRAAARLSQQPCFRSGASGSDCSV